MFTAIGTFHCTKLARHDYVESAARPFFLSWRKSLAASASSQSRKVTIFGRLAVAFGQRIQ